MIALCITSMIAGYTLVISTSNSEQSDSRALVKGDTINIFDKSDLTKGDWRVYINLSRSDFQNLDPSIKKVTCLKTSYIAEIPFNYYSAVAWFKK